MGKGKKRDGHAKGLYNGPHRNRIFKERVVDTALILIGLLAVLILLLLLWRHHARRGGHDHGLLSHRSFYTTWGGAKNLGPRDRVPDELRDDYRKK